MEANFESSLSLHFLQGLSVKNLRYITDYQEPLTGALKEQYQAEDGALWNFAVFIKCKISIYFMTDFQ